MTDNNKIQIVYGTKNAAKLNSMRKCLAGLYPEFDVELIGLDRFNLDAPEAEENGNSPLDNARIKALTYNAAVKQPVFAADSGLYFEGLEPELQPGLNIRRVNGARLDDGEMIEYYGRLAKEHGGELVGRYINGACLAADGAVVYEHMGEDIATDKFLIVPEPHAKRVEGFPLDSLSVHIPTHKYYYELSGREYGIESYFSIDEGFRDFFRTALKRF